MPAETMRFDYRHRRQDLKESLQPANDAGAEDRCESFKIKGDAANSVRDNTLTAGQDSIQWDSANHSGSASIGMGFALGGEQNGFTIEQFN